MSLMYMIYHTLNNTQFSIDAYNALIASIYLHQYFCILIHTVQYNLNSFYIYLLLF